VLGRIVTRVRPAGADAVALELAGERHELWLDAGPGTAGAYLLSRSERRAMPGGEPDGRARQAFLHLRKRLGGERLVALDRVPGERAIVLKAGRAAVALRLWGPAPSLALALDDTPLASLGAGPPAWPPPSPSPEREWDRLDPARVAAAMGEASPTRALLASCPGLGPDLARALASGAVSWLELKDRLEKPQPILVAPGPLDALHDADLAEPRAVALLPTLLPGVEGAVTHPASWHEGAAAFLQARRRGARFRSRRAAVAEQARRDVRRLRVLQEHLDRDLAGLPAADDLRRHAEALLSSAGVASPGTDHVDVPDPYDAERRVRVSIDPRMSLPANADRLFDKARRLERARRQVETRRADTREKLRASLAREARTLSARDLADLDAAAGPARAEPDRGPGGARHYLTGRGLSVLVGRGARENHRLTFAVAGPEDLWLHARDVPGAHVILRDPEGRAGADDIREAAELAAFFSEARAHAQADVHVTRRKHVRAARGGHGRVRVAHSDTVRVAPRDPEGRLRRRL
jgi:hypothetical protein